MRQSSRFSVPNFKGNDHETFNNGISRTFALSSTCALAQSGGAGGSTGGSAGGAASGFSGPGGYCQSKCD